MTNQTDVLCSALVSIACLVTLYPLVQNPQNQRTFELNYTKDFPNLHIMTSKLSKRGL